MSTGFSIATISSFLPELQLMKRVFSSLPTSCGSSEKDELILVENPAGVGNLLKKYWPHLGKNLAPFIVPDLH